MRNARKDASVREEDSLLDRPSSHRRDCPLAQSNEIIPGEVTPTMNHLLPVP